MGKRICPRCETKMEVAEDDDQLWGCPNCGVVLDEDEYKAGHPYYYEYIKDDGKPVFDESTDRSWLEDL